MIIESKGTFLGSPSQVIPPAGYHALEREFRLQVLPHFVRSFISGSTTKEVTKNNRTDRFLRPELAPKHDHPLIGHLEFALKREGLHLQLLKKLFDQEGPEPIKQYVQEKPTGQYSRRAWFLYEWLTGDRIDLPDAPHAPYVLLADPKLYYTVEGQKSPRHQVVNNLPGPPSCCPLVRRTPTLALASRRDLPTKAREILHGFDPTLLVRAIDYLFTKETKSSFLIERETPDQKRAARFVELLREPHTKRPLTKERLLELQNAIVDLKYQDADWRPEHNFVGSAVGNRRTVDYVSPRHQDVPDLMEGLLEAHGRLVQSDVDPVVVAALVAFTFVYIHPFRDGNGRLHRFLIHDILSALGFTPTDAILPVSATILSNMPAYNAALEHISRPLVGCVPYEFDSEGEIFVTGGTADLYRYLDLTVAAEYLYATLERTIQTDFLDELVFLRNLDDARARIKAKREFSDPDLNRLLTLMSQNGGKLSKNKREKYFPELGDEDKEELETLYREAFST